MIRIWVIARITFHEAVRKRLVATALFGGGAFLILFAVAVHFQGLSFEERHLPILLHRQLASNFQMMGMYAINFLIVAITVLTSVDTLSGEISSGSIQAIAVKPVHRWELLVGKWFGFSAMLTLYSAVMILGVNLITALILGSSGRHLAVAFALIWMESMLLLSTTLFFSVSFSTLTAGVLVLGLHGLAFLAGWIEQAGSLTNTPKAVLVGVAASLIMPSEALWRRAAFEMQSPLVSATNLSPFSGASVPSGAMVVYSALYMCLMGFLAARRLTARDL